MIFPRNKTALILAGFCLLAALVTAAPSFAWDVEVKPGGFDVVRGPGDLGVYDVVVHSSYKGFGSFTLRSQYNTTSSFGDIGATVDRSAYSFAPGRVLVRLVDGTDELPEHLFAVDIPPIATSGGSVPSSFEISNWPSVLTTEAVPVLSVNSVGPSGLVEVSNWPSSFETSSTSAVTGEVVSDWSEMIQAALAGVMLGLLGLFALLGYRLSRGN